MSDIRLSIRDVHALAEGKTPLSLNLTADTYPVVTDAICQLPCLTALETSYSLTEVQCERAGRLPALKTLKTLSGTYADLHALLASRTLETLTVVRGDESDPDVQLDLAVAIAKHPTLTALRLPEICFDGRALKCIAHNPIITELSISIAPTASFGALAKMPSLKSLSIGIPGSAGEDVVGEMRLVAAKPLRELALNASIYGPFTLPLFETAATAHAEKLSLSCGNGMPFNQSTYDALFANPWLQDIVLYASPTLDNALALARKTGLDKLSLRMVSGTDKAAIRRAWAETGKAAVDLSL